MRSYQKSGYEWMKLLERYRLNGVLADDMGLGKTLQAISILSDLPAETKSLIVVPKTLLFNWAAELEKFNPHLKYLIYEGGKEQRISLLKNVPVSIVLCSYSLIQNDLEEFRQINFEYIILDEAQHIKNHRTLRARAIKKLNARHKLAMTGTPLENSISELWSIFDFLMSGYLPPLKRILAEQWTPAGMERIRQYIAPFILRRKKSDVLIELPDKQEQVIFCKMSEKQEGYYVSILDSVRSELFDTDDDSDVRTPIVSNSIKLLAALTRLRQICNHPALINPELIREHDMSGKLDTLREILVEALASGRKILIFSQFIRMLQMIEKIVKKLNVDYEYMDGTTEDRAKCINHFNDNEKVRVFLISLKTGGFGINLTAADTVIMVDPWWNPMVSNQAIDRVHRIGQTKKVQVYKLVTIGSVEEKIMHLQQKKRDLFESVIESGDTVLKNLDIEDIKKLFEYK
jgi:SNF2 family DNA or RNA helicase